MARTTIIMAITRWPDAWMTSLRIQRWIMRWMDHISVLGDEYHEMRWRPTTHVV